MTSMREMVGAEMTEEGRKEDRKLEEKIGG